MNTSIATRPQRRAVGDAFRDERTVSASVRSYFNRVRGRFGTLHTSAWVFGNQPEHLLAYATLSEPLIDADSDSDPE